jgi:hypothetical protein
MHLLLLSLMVLLRQQLQLSHLCWRLVLAVAVLSAASRVLPSSRRRQQQE